MKTAKTTIPAFLTSPGHLFSNELRSKLQGHSLYIDRESVDMKQLESLINIGFKRDKELLDPYHDAMNAAKTQMDKKKNQEKDDVQKDAEIISRMAWKKLEDSYRY